MAMPNTARRYTVEEVLAFPSDGNRYELVHGELLVTPSPAQPHQRLAGRLFSRLSAYLSANPGIAEALFAPADITVGSGELVQPDVFVVPLEELGRGWKEIRTLLLVIEVISPSSARYDRVTKRGFYQEHGVPTYWIVDRDAGLVEVWHPDDERPEIVTDVLTWRVPGATHELRIELAEVFAGA
jgi:Uma2 family endonuclease